MNERPIIHCLAALVFDDGRIFGDIHVVSLRTALGMKELGFSIIGPDPHDLFALAQWEREQDTFRRIP